MPSEDECCRPTNPPTSTAIKDLLANLPVIDFDPLVMRKRLAEMAKLKQCPICGLTLSPGMNCPRCLNLIN